MCRKQPTYRLRQQQTDVYSHRRTAMFQTLNSKLNAKVSLIMGEISHSLFCAWAQQQHFWSIKKDSQYYRSRMTILCYFQANLIRLSLCSHQQITNTNNTYILSLCSTERDETNGRSLFIFTTCVSCDCSSFIIMYLPSRWRDERATTLKFTVPYEPAVAQQWTSFIHSSGDCCMCFLKCLSLSLSPFLLWAQCNRRLIACIATLTISRAK